MVNDTIAAIATPPGRGAVSIVRISGRKTCAVAARVFRSKAALRDRTATYGKVIAADGAVIDRGLALFFAGPRSFTGEDVVELHVHGSPAVATETLSAVFSAGARSAGAGEFTRRAFLAGKLDLCAAEAVGALIAAEHRSAARAAAAGLSGGLAQAVEQLRTELARILEELAASLDFPDEVDEPDNQALGARTESVRKGVVELISGYELGRLVREGVSIAVVGPPNAGKSSLLNALLGADRALVSELAGTTRDTIEETLALKGFEARIIDTAGIRAHADQLERAGIERTHAALASAHIALIVIDASQPLSSEAHELLAHTRERERVLLFNKSDLGRVSFDARDGEEQDAILGSVKDEKTAAAVREALERIVLRGERPDLERPHLATIRQVAAAIEAERALEFACATLRAGEPADLIVGDLLNASASLGDLTGAQASEALLDGIFSRFCIGK